MGAGNLQGSLEVLRAQVAADHRHGVEVNRGEPIAFADVKMHRLVLIGVEEKLETLLCKQSWHSTYP